jgi:hypothetical protein
MKQRQDGAGGHARNLVQVAQKSQTIRALIPHDDGGGFHRAALRRGVASWGPKRQSPAFRRGFAKSMGQASATLVAAVLAGILRLLAGLLTAALLLAALVLATLVLTALLLAALVLATLVLTALLLSALVLAALVLTALLAGIVGVLIHHVLSCSPCPTVKMIAKQRFQSRQY